MGPERTHVGTRPSLLAGLAGGALGGAAAGALGSWAALATNGTLESPRDRLVFTLFVVALCAVVGLPLGVLAHLVLGRHRRAGLAGVQGAALAVLVLAFGYFVAEQAIALKAPWRQEASPANLALGAAAGLVLLVLARPLVGALSRPAWAALPVLLLAAGVGMSFRAGDPRRGESLAGEAGTAVARAEVATSADRVVVLGLDGADWRTIDPLLAAGRLPNLARILRTGARAPLRVDRPTWSPILWTTIATGVPEHVHGVRDFTELLLPGMRKGIERAVERYGEAPLIPRGVLVAPAIRALLELGLARDVPVSARQREAPAIWNLASQAGLEVGVVNWYATWPCEVVNGCMVADHDPTGGLGGRLTEASEDHDTGFTYPPELVYELRDLLPTWYPRQPEAGDVERLLEVPIFDGFSADVREAYTGVPQILADIGNSWLGDRFAAAVGARLLERHGAQLVAVYMPGIDRVSHRALSDHVATHAVSRRIVEAYYEAVDGFLAPYVPLVEDGHTDLVLVSDHGWNYEGDVGHEHAPDGILVVAGTDVRPGAVLEPRPHLLDVAPTVLTLLGCPVTRGMPGRVLAEAFAPATERLVAEYGAYEPQYTVDDDEIDPGALDSKLDELQRLGYVDR